MARKPRYVIPGQPQHIIQRGNNRQPIFGSESDYRYYLEKLKYASEKYQCDIHAYVLMTNHVHLLVTPQAEQSIGKMIQTVGRYYVQYFNYCYNRTGTLWEGRYKATLIDTENYFLTCMRYIELNPVRATGMVDHPSKYPWSSYHYNAAGDSDPMITEHAQYKRLGKLVVDRQLTYRELFNAHIPDITLKAIREATNKAWVLGDERFKIRIGKLLSRSVESGGHGGDRKSGDYRQGNKNQGV